MFDSTALAPLPNQFHFISIHYHRANTNQTSTAHGERVSERETHTKDNAPTIQAPLKRLITILIDYFLYY